MKFARISLVLLILFLLNIMISACSKEAAKRSVRITGGQVSGKSIFQEKQSLLDECAVSVDTKSLQASCLPVEETSHNETASLDIEAKKNFIETEEFNVTKVYSKITNHTLSLFLIEESTSSASRENSNYCTDVSVSVGSKIFQIDVKINEDDFKVENELAQISFFKKIENGRENIYSEVYRNLDKFELKLSEKAIFKEDDVLKLSQDFSFSLSLSDEQTQTQIQLNSSPVRCDSGSSN